METSQLALWRSEFGRSYTDRNDREKPERVDSWRRVIEGITILDLSRVFALSCMGEEARKAAEEALSLYGLKGNLAALAIGRRYLDGMGTDQVVSSLTDASSWT